MPAIDDPCTGDLPVARASLLRVLGFRLAAAVRSRLNRRAVARLDTLSDAELYDIGLTRLDLRSALGQSRFFEDPSRRLRQSRLQGD